MQFFNTFTAGKYCPLFDLVVRSSLWSNTWFKFSKLVWCFVKVNSNVKKVTENFLGPKDQLSVRLTLLSRTFSSPSFTLLRQHSFACRPRLACHLDSTFFASSSSSICSSSIDTHTAETTVSRTACGSTLGCFLLCLCKHLKKEISRLSRSQAVNAPISCPTLVNTTSNNSLF